MGKAFFVTKGVLRLVVTVLVCMTLAALGYLAMIILAWSVIPPPRGGQ
jgi:phage shock protein PspC (stress-responsive transcriptional regulator)